jgi:anti-sigma factor RsiW
MSAHLTPEELTEQLMGSSSLTVNAHLLGCPACASELDGLKNSISNFRDSAHAWSKDNLATVGSASLRLQTQPTRRTSARWILVAAAMILLVAGSAAYLRQGRIPDQAHLVQIPTPVANAQVSQSQLDQDNQLLSEVSGELAESVPAPMEPLLVPESVTSGAVTNK